MEPEESLQETEKIKWGKTKYYCLGMPTWLIKNSKEISIIKIEIMDIGGRGL